MAHWNKSASSFSRTSENKSVRYIFLILTVMIMLFSRVYSKPMDHARSMVMNVTSPLVTLVSKPVAMTQNIFSQANDMMNLQEEIHSLRLETEELQIWKNKALELQGQNNALRSLMNFIPSPSLTWVTAEVSSHQVTNFSHGLVISAGEKDGILKGQAVVTGNGLVGRVVDTSAHTSTVLLLTDVNSAIPVVLENTRDRVILSGNNTNEASLKYFPEGATIQKDTQLLTSGDGQFVPAGIPVGYISFVDGDDIRAVTYTGANQKALEVVRVIIGQEEDKTLTSLNE